MTEFAYHPLTDAKLTGLTVLLPAVSVGNTGQLALDLLLNTQEYGFSKVAWIYSPLLLPMAGYQPLDRDSPSERAYPAEVYTNGQFVALQLRSQLVQGSYEEFVNQVVHWGASNGAPEIVVLSSNAAVNRTSPDESRVYYMKNQVSARQLSLREVSFNPELMLGVGIMKKLLKRRDASVVALVCYSDWQVDVSGSYELLAAFLSEWSMPKHSLTAPASWSSILA